MALGSETDWKEAFADMPTVGDTSWKGNLANVIDSLVTNKLSSPGLLGPTGQPAAVFTFGKSAFQGALSNANAANLSAAIQAGITASTVTVAPGSYVGTDTPATKFSAVTTAALDVPSIALASAKVLEVAGKTPQADALDSEVPGIFRQAFLLLTLTTSGLNSVAPTPATLIDAARAMG
jgi:hypothetical protein